MSVRAATRLLSAVAAVAGIASSTTSAHAQSVEQFYKGKTVNLYIGYAPGGGYDFFGRLVARHLGRHIPGQPNVVPQNMPGAGSLRAANFVYNVAPKDGTALGIVTQTVALEDAFGTPGVQYKATAFNWIGRATSNVDMMLTWHTSKVKTFEDALKYETPVAGTGPGSPAEFMPKVLNKVLGTKFKVITGYPGSNEGMLAMEKGEVEGATTSWNTIKTSKQDWLQNKQISLIVQYTPYRHKELPNVPDMVELGKTDEQKQILGLYASGAVIGRSIFTSPGVPAERVKALRDAFTAMTKDPVFLADIEQTKAEFDPMTGEELQKTIEDATKISPAVREKAREARGLE
ncbi:MAG: Bug family tripartite tricarboxylate transporter substrate binding protein [Gemmatimonas sp.]